VSVEARSRVSNADGTMAVLPLLIQSKIEGIGYALACDFLKELGYTSYGKPDVHVKEIFVGLNLCPPNATPSQIQKVISKIAKAAGVPPYDVDKVFWLNR
jgi:thermostable 8-oxoguanine DNA glycosylase